MGIVIGVLTGLFLLDCILLVVVILLQSGKGGGLAAAFGGGGGADSAFGAKVSQPLRKVTVTMAVIFFLIAISLAMIGNRGEKTLGGESIAPAPKAQEQPADKGSAPVQPADKGAQN